MNDSLQGEHFVNEMVFSLDTSVDSGDDIELRRCFVMTSDDSQIFILSTKRSICDQGHFFWADFPMFLRSFILQKFSSCESSVLAVFLSFTENTPIMNFEE